MITEAEINAAANTLTSARKAMAKTFIRMLPRYQNGYFPNLDTKLDDATAVQIQQINAALTKIEALGAGTEAKRGGQTGVDWSKSRNRDAFIEYMLDVLFDTNLSSQTGTVDPLYGYDRYAVGNASDVLTINNCIDTPNCSCSSAVTCIHI